MPRASRKRQFAYNAHTAYDKRTTVFSEAKTIVADFANKTLHIGKKVFDDSRVLSTAYKRPMAMKGNHEWWKYIYDKYNGCVFCPEYQALR